MKAVCIVAFLSVSLGASAGSQPVATDATGMSGMQAESEQSEQCQSGSLIQRSSQKAMLPTKATLGETEVAEPETPPNKVSKKMNNKMNKKMQKRQKMQKEHGDLLAFLAQSKESQEQIPPGDSECTPTGALRLSSLPVILSCLCTLHVARSRLCFFSKLGLFRSASGGREQGEV